MKYIQTTKSLYYKNNLVGSYTSYHIAEAMFNNSEIKITWNNLDCIPIFITGYGGYAQTKRGKKIFLDFSSVFRSTVIKEWRQKDTNLKLVVTNKELKPSLKDLLDYPDGEKAALYLKEIFDSGDYSFLQNALIHK